MLTVTAVARRPAVTRVAGARTLREPALTLARLGFGVALLLVWQALYSAHVVMPLVARSPAQVFRALRMLVTSGVLWPALVSSMEAVLIALSLASVVGIAAGIALALLPRVEAIAEPYIAALNAMPRIAFAPIFIIYFGIGQSAKIALAFTVVIFILLINARAGVRTVDRDVLTMATVMGINKLQLLWKVLLPNAVPSIFAGLRLAVTYSLLGVTASELIAARQGLGQLIAVYSGTFRMDAVYAVVIVLSLAGCSLNLLMATIERRLLRWQAQ
jgi:NitT/TauT family transport system permease protein